MGLVDLYVLNLKDNRNEVPLTDKSRELKEEVMRLEAENQ